MTIRRRNKDPLIDTSKGDLLVTRKTFIMQNKSKEGEQRNNLFHTRCLVKGKLCSLNIDGGSCASVASTTMVDKLNLETHRYPQTLLPAMAK